MVGPLYTATTGAIGIGLLGGGTLEDLGALLPALP